MASNLVVRSVGMTFAVVAAVVLGAAVASYARAGADDAGRMNVSQHDPMELH